jgi:hypothetical protein
METLRDKSKRLLKQVQSDTDEALKAKILGTCRIDIEQEYQTIINIHLLDLSDDIKRITEKLENLVSNPGIRPEVRREILSTISLLV